MFKKDMHAVKGATKHVHKGKGSQMAPMPDRNQISGLARPGMQTMNDYAKATPMAQGVPTGNMEGGPVY